jgi:hypothetical protein
MRKRCVWALEMRLWKSSIKAMLMVTLSTKSANTFDFRHRQILPGPVKRYKPVVGFETWSVPLSHTNQEFLGNRLSGIAASIFPVSILLSILLFNRRECSEENVLFAFEISRFSRFVSVLFLLRTKTSVILVNPAVGLSRNAEPAWRHRLRNAVRESEQILTENAGSL